MGQSDATLFAREGAWVVVADGLETQGKDVAAATTKAGWQARFVRLDVTSEADWEAAVAATVAAFGKLDVLVNNAGISGAFDPDTLSTSAWDRLMNVNAKGVFLGMKHAIPAMRQAGGGAIVNISSISGFVGQDREAVPMRREGRVEEVAYAVLFLASDEALHITGTELVVDGGRLAL